MELFCHDNDTSLRMIFSINKKHYLINSSDIMINVNICVCIDIFAFEYAHVFVFVQLYAKISKEHFSPKALFGSPPLPGEVPLDERPRYRALLFPSSQDVAWFKATYKYKFICTCTCIYIYMYIYLLYIYTLVCVCVCVIFVSVQNTHIYLYLYIDIYIHIYIYIHIFLNRHEMWLLWW